MLRDAWRQRWGRALFDAEGEWASGGYEWHAFGYLRDRCAERDVAVAEYERRTGQVVVLQAYLGVPLGGARFATPPPTAPMTGRRKYLPPDLLVFPESLDWTFAVTHEWGWDGPYFAPYTPPPPAPTAARSRRRTRNGSRR